MTGSEGLMLVTALKQSLEEDAPPDGMTEGPVAALWHVGKGSEIHYERARKLLEPDMSKAAAWVRAHLHRRQGDDAEAAKWYEAAERKPVDQLDREWSQIAAGLLMNQ